MPEGLEEWPSSEAGLTMTHVTSNITADSATFLEIYVIATSRYRTIIHLTLRIATQRKHALNHVRCIQNATLADGALLTAIRKPGVDTRCVKSVLAGQ